jgi:hypothetical protein
LRSDGHHGLQWGHGEDANVANLMLLCHRHHWSVHEGGWQVVRIDGREVLAIPPVAHPADLDPSTRWGRGALEVAAR